MDNEEEGVLTKIRAANLRRLQGDDIGAREMYRVAGDLLTRLYENDIYYTAYYSLPSNRKHLAKDIKQEVFLGAFRNLYKFDENRGKTLKQWLFGIYRHCRVDALQRDSRQRGPEPLKGINDNEKKRDVNMATEDRFIQNAIFQKLLDKLEDLDRNILIMNLKGMTSEEIASDTGLSPAAVRKRIERAIKFLKGEMRSEAKG